MSEIKKNNIELDINKSNTAYGNNTFKNVNHYDDVVEKGDLSQLSNDDKMFQERVKDAIKLNLSNNKKMTDFFNQELYNRINEEIANLSYGEESMHRASGR